MSIRVYSSLKTFGTCKEAARRKCFPGRFEERKVSTYLAVVRGWLQTLVLLAREYVNADKVALGVAVLASLRGGNIGNLQDPLDKTRKTRLSRSGVQNIRRLWVDISHLARVAVNDDVMVLADGTGLLRIRQRRPSIGLRNTTSKVY